MRTITKVFVLLTFIVCFSCEKDGLIVKCSDCVAEEPLNVFLDVKVDLNPFGAATVIKVYEGNLEDSTLYSSITASGTTAKVRVSVNKKYTLTASYYVHDDYYVAVDSAQPRVKYEKAQCEDPCYFVYDRNIDLRLKYTK